MSASNDAFAVHLYGKLARSSGDVLFSPWCLAQVLAMLRRGAAGHTRAEIAALLNGGDAPSIAEADRRYADRGEDWRVATAAWGAADTRVRPTYAEGLRREFDGLVATVNFHDPHAARERINAWAAEATSGRIKNLLDAAALTPLTRLVLTGAAWFKADWATPFPRARTERRPFRRGDGVGAPVDMMTLTDHFRLARGDGVQGHCQTKRT